MTLLFAGVCGGKVLGVGMHNFSCSSPLLSQESESKLSDVLFSWPIQRIL